MSELDPVHILIDLAGSVSSQESGAFLIISRAVAYLLGYEMGDDKSSAARFYWDEL